MVTSTGIKGGAAGAQNLQSIAREEAVRILRDLNTQLTNGNGTKSGILRLMNASDTRGNERKTMTFERKSSWQGKRFSDPAARERTAQAIRGLFQQAGLPTEALDKYLSTHQNAMGGKDFHQLLRTHLEALHEVNKKGMGLDVLNAGSDKAYGEALLHVAGLRFEAAKALALEDQLRVNQYMQTIVGCLEGKPGSGWDTLRGQGAPSELRAVAQLLERTKGIIESADPEIAAKAAADEAFLARAAQERAQRDEIWRDRCTQTIQRALEKLPMLQADASQGRSDFQTLLSEIGAIVRDLELMANWEDTKRVLPDEPWQGALGSAVQLFNEVKERWAQLQDSPIAGEQYLDELILAQGAATAERFQNLEEQVLALMDQQSQQIVEAFHAHPPLTAAQHAKVQAAVTALSTQIQTLKDELNKLFDERQKATQSAVEEANRRMGHHSKAFPTVAQKRLQAVSDDKLKMDAALATTTLPDWPTMERWQGIVSNGSKAAEASAFARELDIFKANPRLTLNLALAAQPPLTPEQLADFALGLHPGEGPETLQALQQFVKSYAQAVQKKGAPQEQGYPALQLVRHLVDKRPEQRLPLLRSMAAALDDRYASPQGPATLQGFKAQGQIVFIDLAHKDASQAVLKDCLVVFSFDGDWQGSWLELKDMTVDGCEFAMGALPEPADPDDFDDDNDVAQAVAAALAGACSALGTPELAGWLADQAILLNGTEDLDLSPQSAAALLLAVTKSPSIAQRDIVAGYIAETGGLWSLLSQTEVETNVKHIFARTLLLQHPADRREELFIDKEFIKLLAKMPELATEFPWLIDESAARLDVRKAVHGQLVEALPQLRNHPQVIEKLLSQPDFGDPALRPFFRNAISLVTHPEVLPKLVDSPRGIITLCMAISKASDKQRLHEAGQRVLAPDLQTKLEKGLSLVERWEVTKDLRSLLSKSLDQALYKLQSEPIEFSAQLTELIQLQREMQSFDPNGFVSQFNSLNNLFFLTQGLGGTARETALRQQIEGLRDLYYQTPPVTDILNQMKALGMAEQTPEGRWIHATDGAPPLVFVNAVAAKGNNPASHLSCSLSDYTQMFRDPTRTDWAHVSAWESMPSVAGGSALTMIYGEKFRSGLNAMIKNIPVMVSALERPTGLGAAFYEHTIPEGKVQKLMEQGFKAVRGIPPELAEGILAPAVMAWVDVETIEGIEHWPQCQLKPQHLDQLKALARTRGIDPVDETQWGRFLLVMSIVMTKLGSVGALGGDDQSILSLRLYGYALFKQARGALEKDMLAHPEAVTHERDERVTPRIVAAQLDKYDSDFRSDRCSDILSMHNLTPLLKMLDRTLYLRTMPPAWIDDADSAQAARQAQAQFESEAAGNPAVQQRPDAQPLAQPLAQAEPLEAVAAQNVPPTEAELNALGDTAADLLRRATAVLINARQLSVAPVVSPAQYAIAAQTSRAMARIYGEFLAEFGYADLMAAAPGQAQVAREDAQAEGLALNLAQDVPLVPDEGGLRANRTARWTVDKAREALDAMHDLERQSAVRYQSAWQQSAPLREAFDQDWRAYEGASQPRPPEGLGQEALSAWLEQQLQDGPQLRRPALERLVASSMAVAEPLTMMNNARKTLLTRLQGLNTRLEAIAQEEQTINDSPEPADEAGQQARARALSALQHELNLLREYLPQLEEAAAQVQPSPEQAAFEDRVKKAAETVADLETPELLEALQAQAREALENLNA